MDVGAVGPVAAAACPVGPLGSPAGEASGAGPIGGVRSVGRDADSRTAGVAIGVASAGAARITIVSGSAEVGGAAPPAAMATPQ
jgi:hypothetical protein